MAKVEINRSDKTRSTLYKEVVRYARHSRRENTTSRGHYLSLGRKTPNSYDFTTALMSGHFFQAIEFPGLFADFAQGKNAFPLSVSRYW